MSTARMRRVRQPAAPSAAQQAARAHGVAKLSRHEPAHDARHAPGVLRPAPAIGETPLRTGKRPPVIGDIAPDTGKSRPKLAGTALDTGNPRPKLAGTALDTGNGRPKIGDTAAGDTPFGPGIRHPAAGDASPLHTSARELLGRIAVARGRAALSGPLDAPLQLAQRLREELAKVDGRRPATAVRHVARRVAERLTDALADAAAGRTGEDLRAVEQLRDATHQLTTRLMPVARPRRIKPRRTNARLDVATPAHGRMRVWQIGSLVPAHDVHARGSTAVVTANDCTLRAVDHYHVRRVSLDVASIRRDPQTRAALRRLVADPADTGLCDAFLRHLDRIATRARDPEGNRLSTPVAPDAAAHVTTSEVVHQGDGSTIDSVTNYHLRETVIPVADVLRGNPGLVSSFVAGLAGGDLRTALPGLLEAVHDVDDLRLLQHADGLPTTGTTVSGFFGRTGVNRAAAVMVGSGNQLTTGLKLDTAGPSSGDILGDLQRLRTRVAPAPTAGEP